MNVNAAICAIEKLVGVHLSAQLCVSACVGLWIRAHVYVVYTCTHVYVHLYHEGEPVHVQVNDSVYRQDMLQAFTNLNARRPLHGFSAVFAQ